MPNCNLAYLMGEHKRRMADVACETDVSRSAVSLLHKGTAWKVNLDSLEQICTLFGCSVGGQLDLHTSEDKRDR